MSSITIHRYGQKENAPVLGEAESVFEEIRKKAYALFERRGRGNGGDVNDWLAAERETLWSPPAELTETEGEFHVRVAVPGFDVKEIEVMAMPDCIVVKAQAIHAGKKQEAESHFSELMERVLFRRIDLPEPIDVDKIKPALDRGVLLLTLEKAARPKAKSTAVAA